jgi:hypothetical protein
MSETKQQVMDFASYKELMEQAAKSIMSTEQGDSNSISFQAGQLKFNGEVIPGNKTDVVIVHSIHENQFFPGRYDPKKIVSPACWAVAVAEKDMAPDPEKVTKAEATNCASCPLNEWGSDPDGGKGKACKNTRRLAMISASNLGDLEAAELAFARLPVMSVANWSKYVTQIGNVVKRPPFGVITELSVVPDSRSQFKVCFTFKGLVPDEVLEHAISLHEQAKTAILFGYAKNQEEFEQAAPTPAKGKGKF